MTKQTERHRCNFLHESLWHTQHSQESITNICQSCCCILSTKEDPHQVRITASRNLINYPGKLTMHINNMTTAEIHWRSILSTPNARIIYRGIRNFYLMATLNWYKYMKMPLNLFPPWIVTQYDLVKKVVGETFSLKWAKSSGVSLRSASLQINSCENISHPTVITNAKIPPYSGNAHHGLYPAPLSLMTLA